MSPITTRERTPLRDARSRGPRFPVALEVARVAAESSADAATVVFREG